jgi:hypothetical protein
MNIKPYIESYVIVVFVLICVAVILVVINKTQTPQITGNKTISTEDYFNNCSNNWTFVSCIGGHCYADGKPIPITGYIENAP